MFWGAKKFFSNRIEKLHKMAFIFFLFFLKKFQKVEKTGRIISTKFSLRCTPSLILSNYLSMLKRNKILVYLPFLHIFLIFSNDGHETLLNFSDLPNSICS